MGRLKDADQLTKFRAHTNLSSQAGAQCRFQQPERRPTVPSYRQRQNVSLVRVPDLQRATSSEFLTFHGFDIEAGLVRVSRSGRYLFASGIGRDGRLWDLDKVDP